MSNPDEQEDTNRKVNEQAAEQAAADKALKDNAESEPADEVVKVMKKKKRIKIQER